MLGIVGVTLHIWFLIIWVHWEGYLIIPILQIRNLQPRHAVACLWQHNLYMARPGGSKDFLSIHFDPGTALRAKDAKKSQAWSLSSGSTQPAPFWKVALDNILLLSCLENNFGWVKKLSTVT